MELKQLEYFMAVCQELHFTRAAEKMGIAQPSLSQQIRLLEHELGTPLFDRVGKKIVMTDAGRALRHHCYNVFHELAQAKAAIGELQGLQRGSLKIGALLTVVNSLLPPAVAAFHRRYPNIELSVLGLRTGDIRDGLLRNELDLGVVYLPADDEHLETIPLYTERLAFVFAKEHPIARDPLVSSLEMLHRYPSILLPSSYSLRQRIDRQCQAMGFAPKPVMEMTTMESILAMVSQGVGVTVLPKTYADRVNAPNVVSVAIEKPALPIQVGIAYRKNKHLCAASRAFMEQLLTAKDRIRTG
ncbi:LysR substrate-binding domain-containing protein [Paenibacillus sp.]|uniref:LysR substrate-binding domain-containing protein n=1 Tax=Paenibacillus sp. TaxID=58172 RepID=UPI002D33668C|nr:LysR substrate-binding domain-containing protein [Paenibacillus sp.]HZG84722.1 LysR substrate-binding domain-containing protein [Paenibacillus sp.]